MLSQHFPERSVQQMGGGVVQSNRLPAAAVDLRLNLGSDAQFARFEHAHMCERRTDLPCVPDREASGSVGEYSSVTHLSAALGVERGVIQDYLSFLAGPHHIDHHAVENQRCDLPTARQMIVAGEFRPAG